MVHSNLICTLVGMTDISATDSAYEVAHLFLGTLPLFLSLILLTVHQPSSKVPASAEVVRQSREIDRRIRKGRNQISGNGRFSA